LCPVAIGARCRGNTNGSECLSTRGNDETDYDGGHGRLGRHEVDPRYVDLKRFLKENGLSDDPDKSE
jgi:hypothetical protein